MRVSEIGEFGLIQLLVAELGVSLPAHQARPGILVDIGDDALVTAPHPAPMVWTTDTLVENVHFLPGRTPWRNVGWKAIAVNLSDIAAMGALPEFALVTLSLPSDFCVEDAIELSRGMRECCEAYSVTIGGGDVVRSPVFSVTVALSGRPEVNGEGPLRLLRRDAARPGDAIAVTGQLGDSAGGLRLIMNGAARSNPVNARLIAAQERPRPRLDASGKLIRAGLECGMDISDGLVQDLHHIAHASGASARIEASLLPISEDLRRTFPDDAVELALTGGEDYQLLVCGPRSSLEGLIVQGLDLTIVGEVLEGQPHVAVAAADGEERHYRAGGWDHFRGGQA